MTWNEVISDASLRDLPYKIELDGYGQIVMSPASNHHGFFISSCSSNRTRRHPRRLP